VDRKQASDKPVTFKSFRKALKSRATLEKKLATISKSLFVAAYDKSPKVKYQVVPTERKIKGQKFLAYEIKIDIDGVILGERSFADGVKSVQVKKHISTKELAKYSKFTVGFAPSHLPIDPAPQKLAKPIKRIPICMDESLKYNTTIFGTDNRRVFQDTSYPWSAFGRCETNLGPFSGVMIGPRHILTCNHGIDWTPSSPGYAADWLRFTPSYYNGSEPFGSSYATHIYWIKKDNNDGFSNGDEDQYDYVVLVLKDRIGDYTGWLGTRRYTDSWDGLEAWWHIGYPSDLTSMERPTYQSWFTMNGDNNQSDEHQAIYHLADVFPGQSGGPMFGFWEGDVGPRAVAVQSWHNSSTNGASGGGDLVDLAIQARSQFP
jgi:V8-like Glu-specific endopeptidase